ncbi:DUF3862 domain-containing protein [Companilactobacillus musae]|uniref:DUF3862 domain-containing protein n=1 Tax=Companilactobacillus musae TaxID=1903258 RepID=UPI000E65214F|nr:DUF3862 domain-containing protein [Companilactobacillus musae]
MNNYNLPTRAEYQRTHKKQKKHFYKKWWFWSIIIIILLTGGGLTGMKMTSMGPFSQSSSQKTTKKKSSTKKNTKKKSGVTIPQYSGIYLNAESGTPMETVQQILGKPSSTSTTTQGDTKTEINTWNNIKNGQLGSNMKVSFTNGHAVSKSITGVKVNREQKLGLDAYSSIQNGQSEDAIFTNLGRPNNYNETIASGKDVKEYTYSSGVKGNTGANFIVTLTDGTVSGKSQTGIK